MDCPNCHPHTALAFISTDMINAILATPLTYCLACKNHYYTDGLGHSINESLMQEALTELQNKVRIPTLDGVPKHIFSSLQKVMQYQNLDVQACLMYIRITFDLLSETPECAQMLKNMDIIPQSVYRECYEELTDLKKNPLSLTAGEFSKTAIGLIPTYIQALLVILQLQYVLPTQYQHAKDRSIRPQPYNNEYFKMNSHNQAG